MIASLNETSAHIYMSVSPLMRSQCFCMGSYVILHAFSNVLSLFRMHSNHLTCLQASSLQSEAHQRPSNPPPLYVYFFEFSNTSVYFPMQFCVHFRMFFLFFNVFKRTCPKASSLQSPSNPPPLFPSLYVYFFEFSILSYTFLCSFACISECAFSF